MKCGTSYMNGQFSEPLRDCKVFMESDGVSAFAPGESFVSALQVCF